MKNDTNLEYLRALEEFLTKNKQKDFVSLGRKTAITLVKVAIAASYHCRSHCVWEGDDIEPLLKEAGWL